MDNIIPFYAYPRSGATLFSTLLNNHPDFIVTPEMFDNQLPTTGKEDWQRFIYFLNDKFSVNFESQATLEDINTYLEKETKYLFYRVWLWGRFKKEPDFAQKAFSSKTQMFLIRNYFHSLGSEKKYTSRDWDKYIKYSILHYKDVLDLIGEKKDIVVHYEDMVNKPKEEYNKLLHFFNKKEISSDDILDPRTNKKQYVSGDYKIKYTNKINKGSNYYKYQFSRKLRRNVKLELANYTVQKYLDLSNPNLLKTVFGYVAMQTHILTKSLLIKIGLFNFFYSFYFKLTPYKKRASYDKKR